MKKCRICNSKAPEDQFLILKNISISSEPKPKSFISPLGELTIHKCESCNYLFIDNSLELTYYDDYLYTPQISQDVKNYLDEFSSKIKSKYTINEHSYKGIEIGSGEGSLCLSFKEKGIDFDGVEPSQHLCKQSTMQGINTYNSYFDCNLVKKLNMEYDFIVIRHVLEHIDDFQSFMLNLVEISKGSTKLIVEVPYLGNILKEDQYYGFFFEHLSYFSIKSLSKLFNQYGYFINDFEFVNPEGGSILIHASREDNKIKLKDSFSLTDFNKFKENFTLFTSKFTEYISAFKNPIIYGAGQRSLTLINMLNLTNKDILAIFDENDNFKNLFTPSEKIPILNSLEMELFIKENNVDAIFIFATSYDKEIYTKYHKVQKLMHSIIPTFEMTSNKYDG